MTDEELRRLAEEMCGEPALGLYALLRRVAEEARRQERERCSGHSPDCAGQNADECACGFKQRSLLAENEALRADIDGKGGWREVVDMLRKGEEALRAERDRLRSIVKGVHGALADAKTVMVPADIDTADLYEPVMQIVRERDRLVMALRGQATHLLPDGGVCFCDIREDECQDEPPCVEARIALGLRGEESR